MRKAIEAFEHDFARWDLHLPADAAETRRGGHIQDAGWNIQYRFGQDPKGAYLDYYASPRDVTEDPPGDDWHVRLYSSGDRAELPTVLEAYMYGRDPSAEELERTRRLYVDRLNEPGSIGGAPGEQPTSVAPAETGPANDSTRAAPGPGRIEPRTLEPMPPPRPVDDGRDGGPASPFAEMSGDVQYLALDIGLDVELALTAPDQTAFGSPDKTSVAGAGAVMPPSGDPTAGMWASSSTMANDDDIVDDLPASLPASAIDEVRRGGLVLFFPTLDDKPAEAVEPPEALPSTASTEMPNLTGAEALDGADSLTAEAPALEASVDTAEVEGEESSSKDWSLPTSEDDGSLLRDAAVLPFDVVMDAPVHSTSSDSAPATPHAKPPGKKVFARADLVLTADLPTIMGPTDPDSFRPWWQRSGSRRIVIAVAAAAVVIAGAVMVVNGHGRSAPTTIGRAIDSTEADAPLQSTPGQAPVSSAQSDSAARPDSQPGVVTPAADTAVSTSERQDAAPMAPNRTLTGADGSGRGTDEGVARPSGPGSLPPIIRSSTSRVAPVLVGHVGRP